MRKRGGFLVAVWTVIAVLFLAGCGSSTNDKSDPPALDTSANAEYPNGRLLVSPDALQKSLGAKKLIVVDARGSDAAYAAGHVPGAIHVVHGAFWGAGQGLKPVAELEQMLGAAGLTRDATIVVYDDTTASWGAAGRLFWMFEYLGCTDVHVLNGGWDKWAADGRPAQSAANTLPAAAFRAQVKTDALATAGHILNRLQDQDFVVIDTRTDEEYLGWQLYGEARGGHLPGSVQVPYAWFYNSDKTVLGRDALQALFESRGITPDKEVTAHCTAGIRSGFAYFALRLMGYPRCSNYDASMFEWAANPALPMEKAANYQRVVYPGWVQTALGGGAPATLPTGNRVAVFECSWGTDSAEYDAGHLPGAVHFNTDTVENHDLDHPGNEIVWDLVPDDVLQGRLGSLGIGNDTTVVVYGSFPIATTRVYWALRYAGVDVRYLNGGFGAWVAGGGVVDTTSHAPAPAAFTIHPQSGLKALTPEVQAYATAFQESGSLPNDTVLVDVRSMEEYVGAIVGYNDPNITRKGRIPGAVWAYDADDSTTFYHDADGTLRSYTEVGKMWADRGITPDKAVIFYCGTGWRSTLSFLYADLMGFPNARNYDSWYVWGTYWDTSTGTIRRDAPVTDPAQQNPILAGWPGP